MLDEGGEEVEAAAAAVVTVDHGPTAAPMIHTSTRSVSEVGGRDSGLGPQVVQQLAMAWVGPATGTDAPHRADLIALTRAKEARVHRNFRLRLPVPDSGRQDAGDTIKCNLVTIETGLNLEACTFESSCQNIANS